MKRIIVIAAVAAVAACSKPAPAPEATSEAPIEAAADASPSAAGEATSLAADGKPSVGMYKVTTGDGKVFMEEVKPDGTYVQTEGGKVTQTGKWVQKSPSEYCATKDEAGAKEECNVEGIDAKGVWTSKDPEGHVATVERVG